MLEGKELEKQIGEYGSVSVDIDDQLKVKVAVEGHVDLMAELHKVVDKTGNPIAKWLVSALEALLKKAA